MQNPQTDRYTPPAPANKYSASVPISVYRELASELQSTQTQLETLKAQNQQLVKQNQQLRQEVEKVVHSAQQLQQLVYSLSSVSGVEVPNSRPFMPPEPHAIPSTPPPRPSASVPKVEFPPPSPPASEPVSSPYTETVVIEQEDTRSRRTPSPEGLSDISGWLLVVAILLIVLTAFGTGFLIVRPLLKNSR